MVLARNSNKLTRLDSMYPLISFQSNIAFLKNPPRKFTAATGIKSVDLLGGLLAIKEKVVSKTYKSQYEFTVALDQLVSFRGIFPSVTKSLIVHRSKALQMAISHSVWP
jgi:hypothetical protein